MLVSQVKFAKLHDSDVEWKVDLRKNVYVIAGPNGAGKTTFAREFLPNYAHCPNLVNADLIAQGVSPFAPEDAAIRAGLELRRGGRT